MTRSPAPVAAGETVGAVPYLAEVAVHAAHHRFAAVAQLFRRSEQADRRALVEGLQPGGAVRVPEHPRPDLSRLPAGEEGLEIRRSVRYGD